MLSRDFVRCIAIVPLMLLCLVFSPSAAAQVDTTQVLGRVVGPAGVVVAKASVELTDLNQGTRQVTLTNTTGYYSFLNLKPGKYSMSVVAPGFRTAVVRFVTLYTQQNLQQNFFLTPGSPLEAVNAELTGTPIGTTGTVGTVVDTELARELPLNGRSFQTLFQLTPGVALTPTDFANRGQFSVNGQRSNSNAVLVDGVSANFDISPGAPLGQSAGGSLPVVTAFGGTNSLASIDNVHEFVILTSSYAPEFGRFFGGQISVVTRSGNNKLHGSIYEYLRNDALDANDWFANRNQLPRAALRQSDYGAVLGGPVVRNVAFWFLSYEGLHLQQPTSAVIRVPSSRARMLASPRMRPFLDGYPLPTGPDQDDGLASAVYSFSNPSGLISVSGRIDVQLNQSVRTFLRYFESRSDHEERGAASNSLSSVTQTRFASRGFTTGFVVGSKIIFDTRFSYSHSSTLARDKLDQFGGAVAPLPLVFPSPFSASNALFQFVADTTERIPVLSQGQKAENSLTLVNLIENILFRMGNHNIKVGFDGRRISPTAIPPFYTQQTFFPNVQMAEIGHQGFSTIVSSVSVASVFVNYSAYFQDSFSIAKSLKLIGGVRWDVSPAPSAKASNGSRPVVLRDLGDPNGPTLAAKHSLYDVPKINIAPRMGLSYAFGETSGPILQMGYGLFYDLGNGPAGNAVSSAFFPFSADKVLFNPIFPLQGSDASPPILTSPSPPFSPIQAFPQELRLPYSTQWNVGIQQPIGSAQTLTATYVGCKGRRLLRTESYIGGTTVLPPDFLQVLLTNNSGISKYDSLQIRYQSLGRAGLHIIASYVLSHSKDNVSSDAIFQGIPGRFLDPKTDYANSDFDMRHTANLGVHYESAVHSSRMFNRLISGWSLDPILWWRSAPPVDVKISRDIGFGVYAFRPDIVPQAPIYARMANAAGGRTLNRAAFIVPPSLRQGTFPRNLARGFPLAQLDCALAKQIVTLQRLKIKLRIEAFNVLNHPNFSPPSGFLGAVLSDGSLIRNAEFGLSARNVADGLQSGASGAGFSPLYQVGGPRSLQVALRLEL